MVDAVLDEEQVLFAVVEIELEFALDSEGIEGTDSERRHFN